MHQLPAAVVARHLAAALEEGILGSRSAWNYFTDGADSSLLATLAGLSAEQASRLIGGTSVAAHVAHLAFAIDASTAALDNNNGPRDWDASWSIMAVDDAAWVELQESIPGRYEALAEAIQQHAMSDETRLAQALAAVAHVAYHLGAIRQKVACLHYL